MLCLTDTVIRYIYIINLDLYYNFFNSPNLLLGQNLRKMPYEVAVDIV